MFSVKFNKYLKERKCSAKKLSEMTEISEPTISRYRTGKTVPSIESGNIECIANALADLSSEASDRDEIYEDLLVAAYEDLEMVDFEVYSKKLSMLMNELSINQSKLAEAIHISASYLSKICSGQVKPRNPVYIAEEISRYVADHYADEEQCRTIQSLIWGNEAVKGSFSSSKEYFRGLKRWLLSGEDAKSIMIENLLYKYGAYEKNMYLTYLHEENVYSQESELRKTDNKVFVGIDGMERAFFLWVEAACASNVNDEIFIFDEIFAGIDINGYKSTRKYCNAIERLIQSGKKITIVNNLEDNLELEAKKMLIWLPFTMSSRVTHYYINEPKKDIYRNMLLISSDVILIGNMVDDDYDNGYYSLIRTPREIVIARTRAKNIMKRATISNYYYEHHEDFVGHLMQMINEVKKDERVLFYVPVPPLATMEEDLLRKILKQNHISDIVTEQVIEGYYDKRKIMDDFLENHVCDITIDYIDRNALKRGDEPVWIAFEDKHMNLKIAYAPEEYEQHIASTKRYAGQKDNVKLIIERIKAFKNMNLLIIPEKYAAVSTDIYMQVESDTNERPIVDSIEELMFDISPSHMREVMQDERRKEILNFFKNLTA